MATAMRCRAHGRLTGPVCDRPGCFEPVEPDVAPVDQEPETCSATACDMPMPCPLHSTGARRDAGESAAYIAASTPAAQPAAVVELRFPWGPVPMGPGELIVGRDHAEQCGAEIEEFSNVSRLHAKLSWQAGEVVIEDQASTNGTTVNGRRIPEFELTALADGDVVGFGAHLRALVSTKGAGQ
ncbi:FHA domain-containing protein [Mycolicibacterium sp. F2034L]|uniref:FHA domain-containing protein n=1 Tax=Mycolicibacterium sp. F2034L TaxID=2926422 RepID=UPI001FF6E706|nr:FHA domain-containing protein [Mycolicibacterium sp. F2034L]MCK0177625.1 FHA domain-containing protein [Mycolicibacterium sp. F2034L]